VNHNTPGNKVEEWISVSADELCSPIYVIKKWDFRHTAEVLNTHIRAMCQERLSDSEILAFLHTRLPHSACPERFPDSEAVKIIALYRGQYGPATGYLLNDAEDFLAKEIPAREPFLTDATTGAVVLYESSLNQIFAFRGIGKSVVANALINCLIQGGDFLRFRSAGGFKTVLVDGELPAVQLQERLKEFAGKPAGLLKIVSPELMDAKRFPNLSRREDQLRFIEELEEFQPDVLIFDTLTRCFRFDTNDVDTWLVVNDFLIELRSLGYCVILVHHAGKNGTSRGLTTGDDNLDLSVKLEKPYGWEAGDGLAFKWRYEKVRHGGSLQDFSAAYDGTWHLTEDDREAEVIELHGQGKTQRAIATALDLSQPTVNRIIRKHGLAKLNRESAVNHDSVNQKARG